MNADDDDFSPEGEENNEEEQPKGDEPFVPLTPSTRLTPPIRLTPPVIDLSAYTRDFLAPLRESIFNAIRLNLPEIDPFENLRESLAVLGTSLQEKFQADLSQLGEKAHQFLKRHFPANWHELPFDDFDAVFRIVTDEGIPLVWVPRAEIVEDLVGAPDEDARRAILAEPSLSDCCDTRDE
ncbi:hypothetical protein ACFHW2_11485 [Actinomadura sp. LOL_016]|uniref:hypothetical protein n=1 Tax=unclassified Actinomadura TaxID=2626254 RepID=UPI003A800F3A